MRYFVNNYYEKLLLYNNKITINNIITTFWYNKISINIRILSSTFILVNKYGQKQNLIIIKKSQRNCEHKQRFWLLIKMTRRWSFYMDFLPVVVIIGNECIDMSLLTLYKAATLQGMNNHVFIAYAYAVGTFVLLPITLFTTRFIFLFFFFFQFHNKNSYVYSSALRICLDWFILIYW